MTDAKIQRYDCLQADYMEPSDNGDFVKFSDYEKLQKRVEVLEEALRFYARGDHQVGMRDIEIRECTYSGTEDHLVGKVAREALRASNHEEETK